MAGNFDNSLVFKVQQANDIVEVIGEYIKLVKKGREFVGLCPFHEDHRPSLYVNPVKQIFKCFACSSGGDVLKFIQLYEHLSFPQAIQRLADRAGIKVPSRTDRKFPAAASSGSGSADLEPALLVKLNSWAAKVFISNLADQQKGKSTRDYLDGRKIDSAAVRQWQIGLALPADDLAQKAAALKISAFDLVKAGLLTAQKSDKFSSRLMFPIMDVTGRIIAFGGRTLDNTDPKYLNSANNSLFDKSNCLYGLYQARHSIVSSGTAVVVEGYTDCIMAHSKGVTNVVATLGTSFTDGHARILKRFAKKVVLIFDSDTAGIAASNRALEICLSRYIDISLAFVPEGKDPCDFLVSNGKEAFEAIIDNAVDVFSFRWNRLTENLSKKDTLIDNKSAVDEFLQTIVIGLQSGTLNPVEKGSLVNRLSRIIGLSASQINKELAGRLQKAANQKSYAVENQLVTSIDLGEGGRAAAEREILEVLLNEPKLLKSAKSPVTCDIFITPALRKIADLVLEKLSSNPRISLKDILAETDSTDLSNAITSLAQMGEKKGNYQARFDGALEALHWYLTRDETSKIPYKNDHEYLKQVFQNSLKQKRPNIGMIE
jgi:DNA primase